MHSSPVDQEPACLPQEVLDDGGPAPEDGLVEGGHAPPVDDVQVGASPSEHVHDLDVALVIKDFKVTNQLRRGMSISFLYFLGGRGCMGVITGTWQVFYALL